MNNSKTQILIIGKPATSKTTFLVQLYSLMRSGNSTLRLEGLPSSIKPIEDAYNRLREGEETQPTPADKNVTLELDVKLNDSKFGLSCPDYGGEQINSLVESRTLKEEWLPLIKDSSDWLLFIKLHDFVPPYDISKKPASEAVSVDTNTYEDETAASLTEGPELVELLQILLYFRAIGIQRQIVAPRLKVVITRWDEINEAFATPSDLLLAKLPLLHQFVQSNWLLPSLQVWGLSAQGFSLKVSKNKEKYQDEGNEKFAYVIRPGGARSSDITELLVPNS